MGVEVDIGKVATPSTRDAHLLGEFARVINQDDAKALLHGNTSAKEPCRPSANDQYIGFKHGVKKSKLKAGDRLGEKSLNDLGERLWLVVVKHVSAIAELNLAQLWDGFDSLLVLLKGVQTLPPAFQLEIT